MNGRVILQRELCPPHASRQPNKEPASPIGAAMCILVVPVQPARPRRHATLRRRPCAAQGAARHGQLRAAERRLLRRARVVHQPADAGAVRGVRPRLAARARAHAHRLCAGRAGDGRLRGRRLAPAGRVPGALVRGPARVPPCIRVRVRANARATWPCARACCLCGDAARHGRLCGRRLACPVALSLLWRWLPHAWRPVTPTPVGQHSSSCMCTRAACACTSCPRICCQHNKGP